MLRKLLGFDRMHENKTFVFCFLKEKINLKILRFFLTFKKKIGNLPEKIRYFNTGFVSYGVNI
jgi:hypothetical protein